ncbi:MAG: hypothetical protein ABMB14_10590, partial [Myxococcota bacterium]
AVFGLTPMLGRLVSLAGTLAGAGAIGFTLVRGGGTPLAASVASVAFLGVYPHTGAFYDLVRPDGLFIGLLGWAIAIGLERHPRAPVVAGLLLAAAFLTKHNAAAFVAPLAVGIGLRDGWRSVRGLLVAFAVPSAIAVAGLTLASRGAFLVYLLEVPASHPSLFDRVWPGMPRELGTPLPIATAAITGACLWLGIERQSTFSRPVTTFAPVCLGMTVAMLGTYVPPPRGSELFNAPSSVAFFALGAIPASLALYVFGWAWDHLTERTDEPLTSWRGVYAGGVAVTAGLTAAVMRAHNGGFLNVLIPWFWVWCVAFGIVVSWLQRGWPRATGVRLTVTAATAAQLGWSIGLLRPERLEPTAEDRALGEQFVAAAKEVDGEVLSPFAAWLPVYAGKPPSLHYMGLWDLEYEDGPYRAETQVIADAIAAHRWALVFAGNQRFGYGLQDEYEVRETLVEGRDRSLMPKTGWAARPNRILVPVGTPPAP